MLMRPSSGSSSPDSSLSVVDFPQPDGPRSATKEPRGIESEMFSTPSCPFQRLATSWKWTKEDAAVIRRPLQTRPDRRAPRRLCHRGQAAAGRKPPDPHRRRFRPARARAAQTLSGRRSEEHTSELQSLMRNSYAVFCLKKKKTQK